MAYTYPDPVPFWQAVPGFFDFADVYQEIVKRGKDGDVFVEVGCYLGRSACFWGEEIKKSGKEITLLACDVWPSTYTHTDATKKVIEAPFESFLANIRQAGLLKIVVPIRAPSVWAASFIRNDLAAVFIDAEHDYENCKRDIAAWRPKVRHHGIIAGHDYSDTFPGVIKASREAFGENMCVVGQTWIHEVP